MSASDDLVQARNKASEPGQQRVHAWEKDLVSLAKDLGGSKAAALVALAK